MDLRAQCDPSLEAGSDCASAPLLCQLECLDGFSSTLPDSLDTPTTMTLCEGVGGDPDNWSWFAFVAGDSVLDLTIIVNNCSVENGLAGVQVGVFPDCDLTSPIVCYTDCDNLAEDVDIFSDQFILVITSYMFVDGCGGSIFDY